MSHVLDAELLVPLLGWLSHAPRVQLRQATRQLVAATAREQLQAAALQVMRVALPSNPPAAPAVDAASAASQPSPPAPLSDSALAHVARYVADSSEVLQQLGDFLLTEQVRRAQRHTEPHVEWKKTHSCRLPV